jgi:GTP cyclohydrolase IA
MDTQSANTQTLEHSLKHILSFIGDDPEREGLQETPQRMMRSWQELFAGYKQRPEDVIKVFEDGACDEMVLLKDIEFFSMCEHHFLPFFGTMSIGYIPHKKVIGVSKLARVCEMYARRLQIQERLTAQVADALMEFLEPQGVMVLCTAQHFCITARGIQKRQAQMVTSAIRGAFALNSQCKSEFLALL